MGLRVTTDYTRREVILGAGSIAVAAGLTSVAGRSGRPEAAASSESPVTSPHLVADRSESAYPLVAYNDHGGPFRPTMPVNVRFDLRRSEADVSTVESVLRDAPGWTRLLSALDARWPFGSVDRPTAWDAERGSLVEPHASYRRLVSLSGPTVGYHVHLWPVRVDGELVGLAGSAHTDVGTARDHLGARYGEAADRLSAPFLDAGWTLEPAGFEFGVDPEQRAHWGMTGDRWLRPPPVA